MNSKEGNGPISCGVGGDWPAHKERTLEAINKVDEMHETIGQIAMHASHLKKLDVLEEIRDKLIGPATGKDHIETPTAVLIFKILGAVIIGLLLTVVFLLTGHFGIPFK